MPQSPLVISGKSTISLEHWKETAARIMLQSAALTSLFIVLLIFVFLGWYFRDLRVPVLGLLPGLLSAGVWSAVG